MQVEPMSPERVIKLFNTKYWMDDTDDGTRGIYYLTEGQLRSAIASVLLYTKGRMPEKPDPSHDDVFKYGQERAIDDCHAVLDEQIAKTTL